MKEPWDVLKEDDLGSYLSNGSPDGGPEVALVVAALTPSSSGEGLAGETPKEAIHSAAPVPPGEGP